MGFGKFTTVTLQGGDLLVEGRPPLRDGEELRVILVLEDKVIAKPTKSEVGRDAWTVTFPRSEVEVTPDDPLVLIGVSSEKGAFPAVAVWSATTSADVDPNPQPIFASTTKTKQQP